MTEDELFNCLACRRWARAVAAGADPDVEMDGLTDEEWLAAMGAHPRIGERGGADSAREQSRAMSSTAATLRELADENRRYEERFGHVFLIYASGRTGEEILVELRRRVQNDPAAELVEARRELRKIVHLRLGALAR